MSNQIKHLHPSRRTAGATYHWKPSATLRRAGWTNLRLGMDWDAAIDKARARNREVEAWRNGNRVSEVKAAPRRARWRDLVARYKASDAWQTLRPKSQAEYDSRIRLLTIWAEDGELYLDLLDRQMVIDLRKTLVQDPRKARTAAAILRVLNILLEVRRRRGYGRGQCRRQAEDPDAAEAHPPPAPRSARPLLDSADALGFPHVRLGIVLGFYSMQREGDLLAATGFQIRPVEDLSGDARRALAGPDGQGDRPLAAAGEDGAWVGVALAPPARRGRGGDRRQARRRRTCTSLILYRARGPAVPRMALPARFPGRREPRHRAARRSARITRRPRSIGRSGQGARRHPVPRSSPLRHVLAARAGRAGAADRLDQRPLDRGDAEDPRYLHAARHARRGRRHGHRRRPPGGARRGSPPGTPTRAWFTAGHTARARPRGAAGRDANGSAQIRPASIRTPSQVRCHAPVRPITASPAKAAQRRSVTRKRRQKPTCDHVRQRQAGRI
jgi:hypothetical protein